VASCGILWHPVASCGIVSGSSLPLLSQNLQEAKTLKVQMLETIQRAEARFMQMQALERQFGRHCNLEAV